MRLTAPALLFLDVFGPIICHHYLCYWHNLYLTPVIAMTTQSVQSPLSLSVHQETITHCLVSIFYNVQVIIDNRQEQ